MATQITNEEVLRCIGLTTMYFTLSQDRLHWLGHILRMGDKQIPKSMLYSNLVNGRRKRGWPTLRFKDVCKHDLKSLNVALISGRSLLMTATNGDLLYTEVLKKEKGDSLRDLSRERIQSRMYLFFSFVASLCLSSFSLVYFQ